MSEDSEITEVTSAIFIDEVVFLPGDILFKEGEGTYHFFIIHSGEVEVYKTGPNHKHIPLAIVGQGTSIGEFAMIDRRPRSATARAKTEVHASKVSESAYRHLLEELPEWATAMMRSLVDRIRATNEIIRRSTAEAPDVRKEIDSVEYDPELGNTYVGLAPMLGED